MYESINRKYLGIRNDYLKCVAFLSISIHLLKINYCFNNYLVCRCTFNHFSCNSVSSGVLIICSNIKLLVII